MNDRRVCLLTGAGGRLGSCFCSMFADVYDVVAVVRHRRPPVADQHHSYVDPLHVTDHLPCDREVFTVESDLTDPGACERIVELSLARFGKVDLVVNAAAHIQHERLTVAHRDPSSLDRAFQLNATLPVQLAATVARMFWEGRSAENLAHSRNVVNISSGAGLGYVPFPGLAAYSASKAAMNFLTCYLAAELQGFGVRVNALAPTTFPDLVATADVCKEIVKLDEGSGTGEIIEVS